MQGKALILGTGNAQVDLIKYLKKAGWFVVGCSYRRQGRGIGLVDQFELVDLLDLAALEKLARREGIDLIYSIGSELAVPAAVKISSNLGLPTSVSSETVEYLRDKSTLRDFLAAQSISPVKYKVLKRITDLEGWGHFPAIVKPVDSQGQRGVFLVNSRKDLEGKLESSLKFSRSKTAIIEEFLNGPEVSANALVVDSRVVLNEISDRITAGEHAIGVPVKHVYPSEVCTGEIIAEIQGMVERCILALKIENGPVYFQLKITDRGPRILEVAARLDGCHIWKLIKTACGVDLLDASVSLLTGTISSNLRVQPGPARNSLSFLLCPTGEIFEEEDHPVPESATYSEYYYETGQTVSPINGLLEKVGYFIDAL